MFLLVDERSMLSAQVLGQIDARLRQGRAHLGIVAKDEPFGGVACVVLSGDDVQLLTINSCPMARQTRTRRARRG